MNTSIDDLAARRQALTAEIAREREQLADAGRGLRRPLHALQQVGHGVVVARSYALWLLLPAAVLAALFPRGALRLAITAYGVWRSVRGAAHAPLILPPPH